MELTIVNLEYKLPTVDNALVRLEQAFRDARQQNQTVLKLIHGYGSTGKGGAIKKAVHMELSNLIKRGKLELFIPGENFSPFDSSTRRLLEFFPEIRKDEDYSRDNAGITIVLVKK